MVAIKVETMSQYYIAAQGPKQLAYRVSGWTKQKVKLKGLLHYHLLCIFQSDINVKETYTELYLHQAMLSHMAQFCENLSGKG